MPLSSGGKAPVTGFHSTIESPDSVSRVAPPTSTMIAISAATANQPPADGADGVMLELCGKPVIEAALE